MKALRLAVPQYLSFFPNGYNRAGRLAVEKGESTMGAPLEDRPAVSQPQGASNPPYYASPRRPIFNSTIDVKTLLTILSMIIGATLAAVACYQGFDKRITKMEDAQTEIKEHFVRVETAQSDFKNDINGKLKEMQGTLGEIRDRVIAGSPANQPQSKAWTRP